MKDITRLYDIPQDRFQILLYMASPVYGVFRMCDGPWCQGVEFSIRPHVGKLSPGSRRQILRVAICQFIQEFQSLRAEQIMRENAQFRPAFPGVALPKGTHYDA